MSISGERVPGRWKGKCRSSEIFGESEAKQGARHGPGGVRKAERGGDGSEQQQGLCPHGGTRCGSRTLAVTLSQMGSHLENGTRKVT